MRSSPLRLSVLVSLVLSANAFAADIIPFGSNWLYLNPQTMAEDPGTRDANFNANWFKPGFNVSGANRFQGPAPEPFARAVAGSTDSAINAFTPGNAAFVRPAATLITLPENRERLTSYFRHEFTTTGVKNDLALEYLVDDGARIYLDGQEIGNVNCCLTQQTGGELVPSGTPTAYTHVAMAVGNERTYSRLPILVGRTLAAGNHVLAVAVHQNAATSNDMGFSARLIDGYIYRPFVESGSEWRYFLGSDEPSGGSLDWTTVNFNDGSWDPGRDGFGYDETIDPPNSVLPLVNTEVIEMIDTFPSLYLRKKFTVNNLAELGELVFTADYDDGFVAYINGREVVRANVPGNPGEPVPFDSFATDHESTNASGAAPPSFSIDLADFPGLLTQGPNNVIALHGLNVNLTSSDFFLGQLSLAGLGITAPPPPTGDFDNNGRLDEADINALSAAVRAGNNPANFDVTADGRVDQADRTRWINELRKTYVGDSNLDGEFSTADLVAVFTAGQFEDTTPNNSTWGTGDWDGNGDFNTTDFVLAFTDGGFEKGPRAAVAQAVPEPSALVLLLMGIAAVACNRSKRSK